jgi:hypothetical protein
MVPVHLNRVVRRDRHRHTGVLSLFAFLSVSEIVFVVVQGRRVECESSSGRQYIEHAAPPRDFTENYLCLP